MNEPKVLSDCQWDRMPLVSGRIGNPSYGPGYLQHGPDERIVKPTNGLRTWAYNGFSLSRPLVPQSRTNPRKPSLPA